MARERIDGRELETGGLNRFGRSTIAGRLPSRTLPEGSKPPIDPEQARYPISEESPEAFILTSGSTWATGDESIGHGDEVTRVADTARPTFACRRRFG
jgi:hypothetical protein